MEIKKNEISLRQFYKEYVFRAGNKNPDDLNDSECMFASKLCSQIFWKTWKIQQIIDFLGFSLVFKGILRTTRDGTIPGPGNPEIFRIS